MNTYVFDDADLNDPLTALRIPVTSSHPCWAYLVAFDGQSEARPTDAEAAMLVSYREEYIQRWYNERWKVKLAERQFDVDGGANGVVFHKWAADDWGYRRRSFTQGPTFFPSGPQWRAIQVERGVKLPGPFSLVALMDHIHNHGDEPNPVWLAWKATHKDVFGGAA